MINCFPDKFLARLFFVSEGTANLLNIDCFKVDKKWKLHSRNSQSNYLFIIFIFHILLCAYCKQKRKIQYAAHIYSNTYRPSIDGG